MLVSRRVQPTSIVVRFDLGSHVAKLDWSIIIWRKHVAGSLAKAHPSKSELYFSFS